MVLDERSRWSVLRLRDKTYGEVIDCWIANAPGDCAGSLIWRRMRILINKTGEIISVNRVNTLQCGHKTFYEISGTRYSKEEVEFLYTEKELQTEHSVQEIAISVLPALIASRPNKKKKDVVKLAIDYAYEIAGQLGLLD